MGDKDKISLGDYTSLAWTYDSPFENHALLVGTPSLRINPNNWLSLDFKMRFKAVGGPDFIMVGGSNLQLDGNELIALQANPAIRFGDTSSHAFDNNIGGTYSETDLVRKTIFGLEFLHAMVQFHFAERYFNLLGEFGIGLEVYRLSGGAGSGQVNYQDKPGKEICTTPADGNGVPHGPGSEASAPPKSCKTGEPEKVAPNPIIRDGADDKIDRYDFIVRAGVGMSTEVNWFKLQWTAGVVKIGDRTGGYSTVTTGFQYSVNPTVTTVVTLGAIHNYVTKGDFATYTIESNKPGTVSWVISSELNRIVPIDGSGGHGTQAILGTTDGETIKISTDTNKVAGAKDGKQYFVFFVFSPNDESGNIKLDTKVLNVKIVDPRVTIPEPETARGPMAMDLGDPRRLNKAIKDRPRKPKPLDSDGDGLSDEQEKKLGTNPHKKDTDGDGIPDNKDKCPRVKGSAKGPGGETKGPVDNGIQTWYGPGCRILSK